MTDKTALSLCMMTVLLNPEQEARLAAAGSATMRGADRAAALPRIKALRSEFNNAALETVRQFARDNQMGDEVMLPDDAGNRTSGVIFFNCSDKFMQAVEAASLPGLGRPARNQGMKIDLPKPGRRP